MTPTLARLGTGRSCPSMVRTASGCPLFHRYGSGCECPRYGVDMVLEALATRLSRRIVQLTIFEALEAA